MNKEQKIEEIMLTIPQKIVAYNGDPKGQHLYGEQRQQIAETLYNAGYRKTFTSDLASDTQKAYKDGYKKGFNSKLTSDFVRFAQKQAVKEFAEKLQKELPCRDYTFNGNTYSMILTSSVKFVIDKLLKEYEK